MYALIDEDNFNVYVPGCSAVVLGWFCSLREGIEVERVGRLMDG